MRQINEYILKIPAYKEVPIGDLLPVRITIKNGRYAPTNSKYKAHFNKFVKAHYKEGCKFSNFFPDYYIGVYKGTQLLKSFQPPALQERNNLNSIPLSFEKTILKGITGGKIYLCNKVSYESIILNPEEKGKQQTWKIDFQDTMPTTLKALAYLNRMKRMAKEVIAERVKEQLQELYKTCSVFPPINSIFKVEFNWFDSRTSNFDISNIRAFYEKVILDTLTGSFDKTPYNTKITVIPRSNFDLALNFSSSWNKIPAFIPDDGHKYMPTSGEFRYIPASSPYFEKLEIVIKVYQN